MYDVVKEFESLGLEIDAALKHMLSLPVTTKDMVAISNFENKAAALRDIAFAKYCSSDEYAKSSYLTPKSAIVHETHQERRSITKSTSRGKLLYGFECLSEALQSNLTTIDHVDILTRVSNDKYRVFLERDIDMLTENAIKFDAYCFSNIIKYWKNICDDELNEVSDDYKSFESRRLFIDEMLDGNYMVHGVLDKASAIIFKKAIEDIANKMWRNDHDSVRGYTSQAAYRADAAGYLGQLYINNSNNTNTINSSTNTVNPVNSECSASGESGGMPVFNFTVPISSDIIIDIEELYNSDTRKYLKNNLEKVTPIQKACSKSFIKQILCDSDLTVPIKNSDGTYNYGRKIRIAPRHLKRILALQTHTCSIPGCSIPSSWCDAHHIYHWLEGGETKIENLVLLCRRHHTMIHNDKTFAEKASKQITEYKNRHNPP
jgi:hypothetical protein